MIRIEATTQSNLCVGMETLLEYKRKFVQNFNMYKGLYGISSWVEQKKEKRIICLSVVWLNCSCIHNFYCKHFGMINSYCGGATQQSER